MSLRHNSQGVRGELNLFYYNFNNFIFPFAPGEVEDGLPVIEFTQLNARFLGTEANLGINLNPKLWLNLGMDYVDAQETDLSTPLPRISSRFEASWGSISNHLGFRVSPELIVAAQQPPDLYRRDPHARIRRDEPEGLLHPRPSSPGPSVPRSGVFNLSEPALPQPFLIHQGLGSRDRPRPCG